MCSTRVCIRSASLAEPTMYRLYTVPMAIWPAPYCCRLACSFGSVYPPSTRPVEKPSLEGGRLGRGKGEGLGDGRGERKEGIIKNNNNVNSITSMRSPLPPLRGPKVGRPSCGLHLLVVLLNFFVVLCTLVSVCKCIEVVKHLQNGMNEYL